jgi:hypothetical protein
MNKKQALQAFVAKEIIRCKKNPIYFLEKYCKVLTEADGPQPFVMYDFQKEKCIKNFLKHRNIVIVKGRQTGVSTIIAGYILWNMIFRDFFSAVVISKDTKAAQGLVKKIQIMIDYMPIWLRPKQPTKNKESLEFSNGSKVEAFASTTESGRSFSPKFLVFDEGAFIPNAAKIYTAAKPSLSKTRGQFVMVSTPNGKSGFFSEKYHNAPENGFHAEKIMWYEMPERDEQWAADELRDMGKKGFSQEYCCDFQQSGSTVIEPEDITFYEENYICDPVEMVNVMTDDNMKLNKQEEMWYWKRPVKGRTYIIVGDVSRGDREDNSACHVFDLPSIDELKNGMVIEQVAEFYGKIPTDEYGQLLYKLGMEYNEALIVVENSGGLGIATLNVLVRMDYMNLYYTDASAKQVSIFDANNTKELNTVPGFVTSTANRHNLLPSAIEKMWRTRQIIVHSKRTLIEAWSWIWKGGKAIHDDGCHDDAMMALAIFSHIYDTSLKEAGIAADKFNQTLNIVIDREEKRQAALNTLKDGKQKKESKNPWHFRYQEGTTTGGQDEEWDLAELLK